MKVLVIASGSKGNCTYIASGDEAIMIDAGISYKRISQALDDYKLDAKPIALFVTHEHADHVCGLRVTANKFQSTVYLTEKTYNSLPSCQKDICYEWIEPGLPIHIGSFTITPVRIFHDAKDPVGYVICIEGKKIVYITDTGYVHSSIFTKITNADAYILESNHDPDALINSERPFELKRRILGDRGHLCNGDSADVLCRVIGERTKVIVHAHISEECNLDSLVVETMKEVFSENGLCYENFQTKCASQNPFYFEV